MVETPPCVSKAHDWGALCISLDSCSVETSDVVSVSEEIVLQKNKIRLYRICTSDNKIHRYMPYKIYHKKNDKAKANHLHILFAVLPELKQLQSFTSTEQLNDCQLIEEDGETSKCVSIALDSEYFGISQEICSNETPLSFSTATDWKSLNTSIESCSVDTSNAMSVSEKMDLIGSWHIFENKAVASDKQKTKVQIAFDEHIFDPSCMNIAVFMTVMLLKARIHNKSVGDHSPNILPCTYSCPSIAQLQSYVISLHKRDFPD